MRMIAALLFAGSAGAAVAAPPSPSLTRTISGVEVRQGSASIVAHILVASSAKDRSVDIPDELDAVLHIGSRDWGSRDWPVRLVRQGDPKAVPAGGWALVDYRAALPGGAAAGSAVLSLEAGQGGYAFALSVTEEGAPARTAEASPPPLPPRRDTGERPWSVLTNLSADEPVYVVAGSGTDTDVKIQLSFQYQLFGRADESPTSWLDGFRFAYTQRIFWDVPADSQPFRDVSYQPELFYRYDLPGELWGGHVGARAGFLHESNGKGGPDSRGYQYLYIQPQIAFPVGSYTVSIGPRLAAYVLGRDNNPDIARYRGHQALSLSIGRDDGLKLSTFSRYNFSTGKGSVDADLTYPVRRLIGRTPLYLVVQGFTGYGEDLLDYNRRQTRVRAGLGIIR